MSRFPQPVELDLSAWQGCAPHELTGGVPFPPIGELPYLLTLPGHGFYWFSISAGGRELTRVRVGRRRRSPDQRRWPLGSMSEHRVEEGT